METVKHKLFGVGEVIKKDGNYLTVRFQNDGSEKHFIIPNSFQLGVAGIETGGKIFGIDEESSIRSVMAGSR